jgi:uncharacterized membrane protein
MPNTSNIKVFVLLFIILIACDAPYLAICKNLYANATKKISGREYAFRIYSGIIVYIALALGLIVLVLPRINTKGTMIEILRDCAMFGGVFVIVSYATFDFTMHFMFDDWTLALSLLDTFWGGLLCTLVSFLFIVISKKFKLM